MTNSQFYTSRRNFLQNAGLGCGSLALTKLLSEEGLLGQTSSDPENSFKFPGPHFAPKAKSVIWLFMPGSPSQVDTFDYKPELQKRNGEKLVGADPKTGFFTTDGKILASPFSWKQHGESGTWVSEIFPNMAQHVDDMAFLYSCYSQSNNHTPAMLEMNSGMFLQGRPAMGSWVTYGLGSENENLPGFVVLHGAMPRGGKPIWAPGFLPKKFQPTAINGTNPIGNLTRRTNMGDQHQRAQLDILRSMNRAHGEPRSLERDLAARIESFELAYRMQTAAPEAMDVDKESKVTQQAYGLDQKETQLVGRQCIMARRLVERGVRFVHLYHRGWDHHGGLANYMKICCGLTDRPTWALLTDLKQRGLLEDTLVIWGGEFGRTPMFQGKGGAGRDHHIKGFSMWMAGGGIKGGASHGATDELGYHAQKDVVHVRDLHATMLHQLGINHENFSFQYQGLDMRLTGVEKAKVVRPILA